MNLKNLAKSGRPILILGETGTGKSHLARKIHVESVQAQRKFIHLNIATLNKNLFESELFGHVKGAFSGAMITKKGFCEEVGSGTLFIDEIGELCKEHQAKLLTLIDERLYFQVGSCVEKQFNGRLIFATNKDLKKMVRLGTFRKDLYFRLRFFMVDLDPLREKENLFTIILDEINNTKVRLNLFNTRFPTSSLNRLLQYSWPGNYRELKNTIEYLLILGKSRIDLDDMPSWIDEKRSGLTDSEENSYQYALECFEKAYFKKTLSSQQGKINLSAQVAGISKVTLISKLKKYGIDRRKYKNIKKVELTYGF